MNNFYLKREGEQSYEFDDGTNEYSPRKDDSSNSRTPYKLQLTPSRERLRESYHLKNETGSSVQITAVTPTHSGSMRDLQFEQRQLVSTQARD